ncbi:MAG: nucleoside triphosphate pyrophosphohydrolase [Treponema sp.]|nr:nucleoside triphosphate pyrophosphohydrolase [Treponema sp.]
MEAFRKLYDVIVRLRSPDGCAWDREQTPHSLRGGLIEETYECVEAIDQQEPDHIKEELGDIFLLITMIAYIHEQQGLFSVADVLEGNAEKLIRRHPHVFGEPVPGESGKGGAALSPAEILKNWARMKVEKEGRKPKDSILDEVSRGLPPLDMAWKLQKKAAKAGFDWPEASGVVAKIKEELEEVEAAIANTAAPGGPAASKSASAELEGELGDLLFSVVNLCRFFDIEPSVALQRTNAKFTGRFKSVEKRMKESGQEMSAKNLAVMDHYWNMTKNAP